MGEVVVILFGYAILAAGFYFVIKWAVKNGIKEAYRDIAGKKDIEN